MKIQRVERNYGILMIPGLMVLMFILLITFDKPPSEVFSYKLNSYTTVSVYPHNCIQYGRGPADTLDYIENDVEKSLTAFNPNRAENPGFKACMASFTEMAKSKQREGTPVNPSDERFKRDIYTKVGFGYNEQGPYFTTFYLNGKKINELTMAIEACVNPVFNGQATLSYQGKAFRSGTLNDIEQDFRMGALVDVACENLMARRT